MLVLKEVDQAAISNPANKQAYVSRCFDKQGRYGDYVVHMKIVIAAYVFCGFINFNYSRR